MWEAMGWRRRETLNNKKASAGGGGGGAAAGLSVHACQRASVRSSFHTLCRFFSPSAHFLLIAQLHFTDYGKCFIKCWKGVCPRGWIPYEKCIATAAWVCLHTHVGLIKASRKSIRKQPYSHCLCTIFTMHGLIVEECGYKHKRVLGRYFTRVLWHDYPLVII